MGVLAIDAGTTGVTALVVDADAQVVARGYAEFPQHFPADGQVEHEPDEIWAATLSAVGQALEQTADAPTAVGITNQRETAVLWDREDLTAPRPAIVWQDRRTAGLCEQLSTDGYGPLVAERTGLRLDPYFTGTKLRWLADNERDLWRRVEGGQVAVGTVDSYLIARLTAGREHVTDHSNASRTLLYDLASGTWDEQLCALFWTPPSALPRLVPSYGPVARTDPAAFLGLDLPIAGIAGDQQAALFGQGCVRAGMSKCTYGTGSFVLVHTGSTRRAPGGGLLTTVAWAHPDGRREYALEGSIFVTGAAVQWLRDGLGILSSAAQSESLARSVPDSGGVVFVPALTGLGAPDWDPTARGTILGLTRASTRAHLVRATLEAIAYEVQDVVDLMVAEGELTLTELAVDGGAAANDLLCELQAAALQVPVERAAVLDTTGLGAALLAGVGTGVWPTVADAAAAVRRDARFEPGPPDPAGHRRWRAAVARARSWAG